MAKRHSRGATTARATNPPPTITGSTYPDDCRPPVIPTATQTPMNATRATTGRHAREARSATSLSIRVVHREVGEQEPAIGVCRSDARHPFGFKAQSHHGPL